MVNIKLNDLCHLITCGVAKRPEYQDEGIPFLSSLNVKENRVILDKYKYVSREDHNKLTKYSKPENNDLLYTRVGSYGEAAVINLDMDFSIFVSLTLIKPKNDLVDSRYLMWYLNSPKVRDFANQNTTGVGVKNLNVSVVREYIVPLPTLSTQKAIAEKLDNADALRKKDKELLAQYDELAQAIFIDMFGDPVKNEKGWEMTQLGNLGEFKNGLNFSRSELGTSIKILGVGDFGSKWQITDIKEYSQITLTDLPSKDFLLKENDIVFVRSNGNKNLVGRSLLVRSCSEPITFGGFCIRFRATSNKFNELFLVHLLRSSIFRKHMISSGRGANIQNINQEILNKLKIILPPNTLQSEFAEKITNIEAQKALVKQQAQQSENLFQALLQESFNFK